jgi:sugar phosphate isomerase/epimerase
VKFAPSTNWNSGQADDGAAIADEAGELGFDALELGFKTRPEHIPGIRRRLDVMPVASVHAYCPAPVGAPAGHPELYRICSSNADERTLARVMLTKTIRFAAELGAKAVVFHAGYVDMTTLFGSLFADARKLRIKRGRKMIDVFLREFEAVRPELEKAGVELALENLPSFEGFPDMAEARELMAQCAGAPLKLWFDTGHALVRETCGWDMDVPHTAAELLPWIRGMHLNDVKGAEDEHREPGWGNVDFARLAFLGVREDVIKVFEPHRPVAADDLRASLAYMRRIWNNFEKKEVCHE